MLFFTCLSSCAKYINYSFRLAPGVGGKKPCFLIQPISHTCCCRHHPNQNNFLQLVVLKLSNHLVSENWEHLWHSSGQKHAVFWWVIRLSPLHSPSTFLCIVCKLAFASSFENNFCNCIEYIFKSLTPKAFFMNDRIIYCAKLQ